MNPYFSFQRFFNLIKLNLSTHILSLALTFLIYFGIVGGINFWILHSLSEGAATGDAAAVVVPLIVFVVFFVIFMLATPIIAVFMASKCAKNYHRRASATQLLMLPASKIEQFSVLYLLYVVIVPVLFYLVTCLVEYYYIHNAMVTISGMSQFSQIKADANTFSSLADNIYNIVINPKLFLMILSSQSIFFAGAIFFKTHPFIKTVLCLIGLIIVVSFVQNFVSSLSFLSLEMDSLTSTTGAEYGVAILITLACSTFAWFQFKRTVLV